MLVVLLLLLLLLLLLVVVVVVVASSAGNSILPLLRLAVFHSGFSTALLCSLFQPQPPRPALLG